MTTSMQHEFARLTQRETPSQFVPVIAHDPSTGIFLCDDGHIGVCYSGHPVNGADDTSQEMLKGAFSVSVPDDTFIQIGLLGMPNIERDLACYHLRRETGLNHVKNRETRDVLERYYQGRARFVEDATERPMIPSSGVKVLNRTVVLTIKIPYKGLQPTDEEINLLAETGAKISESIQSIGLFLRRMDALEYLQIAYRLTHPFSDTKYDDVRDMQLLRDQVFEAGEHIEIQDDAVVLNDEAYAQTLSTSRWPKKNALSLMAFIIGDPMGSNNQIKTPYYYCLTLRYPNQFQITGAMRQKSTIINYQAFGPMLRFVPRLALKKQGMDPLIAAIEQSATIVKASLTLTFYARTREEVARQVSSSRTYLQSFDLTMGEERRILLATFWNAFPLFPTAESTKNTYRFHTMAVEHAMTFAPILGEWKGTSFAEQPRNGHAMLMVSRRGQLMPLDFYDSATNYNSIVFAESGSGKSFFTQQVIMDYLSVGAKIWVIDVGRSYYKLASMLHGSFVEFNAEANLCLNPFSTVENIDEEVGLIQALLEKMAAPEQGLDDYRRSRIEEAVKAVWGHYGHSATVTEVANYLTNQVDERVADIGTMLYRFTRHGSEGFWFDGEANVDLNSDLVVLELEELKEKRTLQQVVLMQVIATIQREMYLSQDDRPKILVIDEAWDLLDDPMVGRFMEHAYRRFRKYGGAAMVVTQSIADLYRSPSGRAIAENSAFKFILRQTKESINQVKKEGHLALGEYNYSMMETVHTVPGKYSEIMCYTNMGTGITRLVVDRFSQVLFSTAGPERTEVMRAIQEGAPPLHAVEDYIAANG